MIFKVNIDKQFREIEEKVIEEQRNIGEKSLEEEEQKKITLLKKYKKKQ